MNLSTSLTALAAASASLAFAGSASAETTTLVNTKAIALQDRVDQSSSPGVDDTNFPSDIAVLSLSGSVTGVKVTVKDVSSTFPGDLDLMLEAPDGHAVMLMSDTGGDGDLSHADLTFDDAAASPLPDGAAGGFIKPGTFKPTDLVATGSNPDDSFPGRFDIPTPDGTTLSSLNGHYPNGTWRLLAADDAARDLTTIAGGWSLTVTTAGGSATSNNGGELATADRGPGASKPTQIDTTNTIKGADGVVDHLAVTLDGQEFQNIGDADVLLVGPNGRAVVLMSDLVDKSLSPGAPVRFTDNARSTVGELPSLAENVLPTNVDSGQADEAGGDFFDAPAPPGPYDPSLDVFKGISPNGDWRLFLTDDEHNGRSGDINGGWTIDFTLKPAPSSPGTEPPPAPAPTPTPAQEPPKQKQLVTLGSLKLKPSKFTARKGTKVSYKLSAKAKVKFTVQRRAAKRFKKVAGNFSQTGAAGANKLRFKARIGTRKLAPGLYRLTAKPAGGKAHTAKFQVKP